MSQSSASASDSDEEVQPQPHGAMFNFEDEGFGAAGVPGIHDLSSPSDHQPQEPDSDSDSDYEQEGGQAYGLTEQQEDSSDAAERCALCSCVSVRSRGATLFPAAFVFHRTRLPAAPPSLLTNPLLRNISPFSFRNISPLFLPSSIFLPSLQVATATFPELFCGGNGNEPEQSSDDDESMGDQQDSGDEDGGVGEEDPEEDDPQDEGGSVRRARSSYARRGRAPQVAHEEEDEDVSVAMRLQRELNDSSSRRRSARVASQDKRPVYDEAQVDGDAFVDSEDDEEAARRIDREVNGLRPTRPRRAAAPAPAPRGRAAGKASAAAKRKKAARSRRRQDSDDDESPAPRSSRATRTSNQAIDRKKYVEDTNSEEDSDEAAERRERRAAQQKAMSSGPCPANGFYVSPYPEDHDDEVERVLGHRDIEGIELNANNPWRSREFHIKWKRYAYIHSSWDTLATLEQLPGIKRVQNYMKRVDELVYQMGHLSPEEQELINLERQMQEELIQDHMCVDRVIDEFIEGDETKYLVKWNGLPYAELTWELKDTLLNIENGVRAIDDYQAREARLLEPTRSVDQQRKSFLMKGHRALASQPKYLEGGELRDYQLAGLNWLIYSWSQDNNCILADEMGLGKTIQCVSHLAYLAQTLSIMGPFLVIVPLSTVHNWVKEFAKWAPMCNTVVYVGDSLSRGVLRRYEMYTNRKSGRQYKFEIMISTFEVVLKDASVLNKIKWSFMMMDEAHRLKNHESALYVELMSWHFKNTLLVTGTPLQNSIQELWALLHFLEPDKFHDMESFVEMHSLDSDQGIASLHRELGPHLLRRVIKDVEKSLPPKIERILRVEMTPLQKQYYKWILNRNFQALNKGARGSGHVSLLNIITELKKTCNHPFLFESAEESYRGRDDGSAVDRLVSTSGKMVILDKLLQRLKATGHRVLIFSQMVRVLDIISEYLRLRGYCHQRLDGSTPAGARHQAMNHFNAEGSPDFAFLLSTRAGGLGINLATADTVVIFDSDWNPQNDLQAMSRAHRIGQKETVNIYRMVTSNSVEENILERAKQKMVLDHVVIQRMDTSGRMVLDPRSNNQSAKMFDKDELAAILRFGAEKLFKDGSGDKEDSKASPEPEEDIDDILARAEKVETNAAAQPGGATDLLNQFNYATFKNEEDDATFWNRLIPKEERMVVEEEKEELLPRQARLRAGTTCDAYDEREDPGSPKAKRRGRPPGSESRSGPREKRMVAGPPLENCHVRVEEVTVPSKGADDPEAPPRVLQLSKKEANAMVRAVRKFGSASRIHDIAKECNHYVAEELDEASRKVLYEALLDGCNRAVKAHAEQANAPAPPPEDANGEAAEKKPEKRDAQLDFFGCSVKASDLLGVVEKLEQLHHKLHPYQSRPGTYRLDTAAQMSAPKWGAALGWTPKEDAMLLMGVHIHGLNNWDKIASDETLALGEKLGNKQAAADGKLPKASHLETRALGLMKKMQTLQRKPPRAPNHPRLDKVSRARGTGRINASSARGKREGSGSELDADRGKPSKRQKMPPKAPASKADPEKMLDSVRVTLKKLRTLQRHKDIPKDQAISKTKKYLKLVGKHISDLNVEGPLSKQLWEWVSNFTENPLGGDRLKGLYNKLAGVGASGAAGSSGAGAAAAQGSSEAAEDRRGNSHGAGASQRPPGDVISRRKAPSVDSPSKHGKGEDRHGGHDSGSRRDYGDRDRDYHDRHREKHRDRDRDRDYHRDRDRGRDRDRDRPRDKGHDRDFDLGEDRHDHRHQQQSLPRRERLEGDRVIGRRAPVR